MVAGILSYLIPGAGHFYQGRTLKGVIYCVCILGLFFWGQKLGEGMVVNNAPGRGSFTPSRYVALSYAAQLGAGAPALPALIQNARAERPGNIATSRLTSPLAAEFEGMIFTPVDSGDGRLVGTIRLEPTEGQFGPEVRGEFTGTLDGQPTKLTLGGRFRLDKPIKAGFRRELECEVIDEAGEPKPGRRRVLGSIPRPFLDAYGSPPEPEQIQETYERLGTLYDLALVFTWIAGLLNVLAIWDCVCGPAYGFGDEHSVEKERSDSATASGGPPKPDDPPKSDGPSPEPPRSENRTEQKSPV